MTKQDASQPSKQGGTTSKQPANQAAKQGGSANKQSTGQATKEDRSASKRSTNQTVKQDRPAGAGKPLTRQAQKDERRREEQLRRERERRGAIRRKVLLIGSAAVAVLLVAAISVYYVVSARSQSSQQATVPCQSTVNPAYPPVDNICCDQLEQTTVHYHALVLIYIDGQPVQVPQNVGIASDQSCFYWMHTHDTTGVIHMEAPSGRDFTLGNFLDIWSTQFSQLGYQNQLSSASGWVVYIGGQKYSGDFHNILMKSHLIITLAYNSPNVKPTTVYSWGNL